MPSLIPGYEYDIFISYRQKDNKGDRWVSRFVDVLKTELESAFKDDISVYFDENPHDRLQETHNVDKSLEGKLRCLVFIPILSQTYCDPNCFAWQNEFMAFIKMAENDHFGKDVKLRSGNVASRILPIRIHDLEPDDVKLFGRETGSVLRSMDFVYKTSSGVNRPLQSNEDHPNDNLNKTFYRDQINKVANAIKDIISGLKNEPGPKIQIKTKEPFEAVREKEPGREQTGKGKISRKSGKRLIIVLSLILCLVGAFAFIKIMGPGKEATDISKLERSIAVLPFTNDSPDKENEYFCNGMMEEILTQLQKIKELRVKARTSVERYRNPDKDIKEIGHELGVSLILEGSVRKMGDDIRITAQLIEVKSGNHLWAEIYNGKYTKEIFEFQSNVAKKVAASLNAVITPKEVKRLEKKPTTDMLAYDLCAKGEGMTVKWNNTSDNLYWKLALNLYNRALEVDPEYVGALSGKCWLYRMVGKHDSSRICAKRIMEIDPESWEGPAGLGSYYMALGKYDSAFIYWQKSIDLGPNEQWAYGGMGELLFQNKNEILKGLSCFQKAYDLGGNSDAWINNDISWVYTQIGDYPKGLKYVSNALSLSSECFFITEYGYVLSVQGKYDEALHDLDSICSITECEPTCDFMRFYIYTSLKEFEKAEKYYNKAVNSGYKSIVDFDIYLAYLYKETGRKNKAISVLNNLIKREENELKGNNSGTELKVTKLNLAAAWAMLDENKKALYYLSELEKTGLFEYPCTLGSVPFDNLRNDPEFKAIVKRIGDNRSATRQKIREMEERGEIDL
jgi:TolB-like protein/Tfp pilus assembly protein PilF